MTNPEKNIISPELPDHITNFAPVPVKPRGDGWSPGRQRAFIQTLAETGSVTRAAKSVNLTAPGAYYLRRHPQGGEFRQAWEAGEKLAIAYIRDIAFERTIEGQLEPVWQGGKLVGYRRKFSDTLLMFMLKNYGDGGAKRVTVNYVKSSAQSHSGNPAAGTGQGASAETSIVTMRSNGGPARMTLPETENAAAEIEGFSGVELDPQAEAEIARILQECAARREEFGGTTADLNEPFVRITDSDEYWQGNFEPEGGWAYDVKDVE